MRNRYNRSNSFIVRMVRKRDGVTFFRNPMKSYSYEEAVKEAERSARNLSRDYSYLVTELVNVVNVETAEPRVVTTYL